MFLFLGLNVYADKVCVAFTSEGCASTTNCLIFIHKFGNVPSLSMAQIVTFIRCEGARRLTG